jgi:hypothetical protein
MTSSTLGTLSPFVTSVESPQLILTRTGLDYQPAFASLSIAAGVSLFELSRFMGTSPAMLDKTYGHLLPDALDRGRMALDSFISTVTLSEGITDARE